MLLRLSVVTVVRAVHPLNTQDPILTVTVVRAVHPLNALSSIFSSFPAVTVVSEVYSLNSSDPIVMRRDHDWVSSCLNLRTGDGNPDVDHSILIRHVIFYPDQNDNECIHPLGTTAEEIPQHVIQIHCSPVTCNRDPPPDIRTGLLQSGIRTEGD